MGVALNGTTVLEDFDVFSEAGGKRNRAVAKEFDVSAPDGTIEIAFSSPTGNAIVNGVEIIARKP